MPCTCDGAEPNARQAASREAAKHLVYLAERSASAVPLDLARAAASYYGDAARADELVAALCGLIRGMDTFTLDRLVYAGRDPRARALADWWDRHQAWDRERQAAEAKKAAGPPTPPAAGETLELKQYFCACCRATFYDPLCGDSLPERCPYCGSTTEFDTVTTLAVRVVQTWGSPA